MPMTVFVQVCVYVCVYLVNLEMSTDNKKLRKIEIERVPQGRETPNKTKRTVTPLLAVPINSAFRQYFVIFVAFFLCKKQKHTKNLLTSLTPLHTHKKSCSARALGWRSGSIKLATDPDNSATNSPQPLKLWLRFNADWDADWDGDWGNGNSNGIKNTKKINDYGPQTSGTFLSAHWGGWTSGVYHAAAAATASFAFRCDWTATATGGGGGGIASDCSWHSKQTSSGHRNSRVHCLSIGFRSWDCGRNWQKVVVATCAELTDWLSWQWIQMILYAHISHVFCIWRNKLIKRNK